MAQAWPRPSGTQPFQEGDDKPPAQWWVQWLNTLWNKISGLTFPTTGTVATTSNKLSAFAATTSAELASVISDEVGASKLLFGLAWVAFTVSRTGWTDVGSPTVTGRYCQLGPVTLFQVKIVPGTTTATTAGTSYIAFPVTAGASGLSGIAAMMNITTAVAVGDCSMDITNSRCYVPTQAPVGNTLTVFGIYEG